MSGGYRSHIDKAELTKTLNIKCLTHGHQLKTNLLAGKQSMKQYRPKRY